MFSFDLNQVPANVGRHALQMCLACPNIESLHIRGCFLLSDTSLQAIGRYLTRLRVRDCSTAGQKPDRVH
jgi:hypothetical protein